MLRELESKGLIVVVIMVLVTTFVVWSLTVGLVSWAIEKVCDKLKLSDEHDSE